MSGLAQFLGARGIDVLKQWCEAGYQVVQRTDAEFSGGCCANLRRHYHYHYPLPLPLPINITISITTTISVASCYAKEKERATHKIAYD